MNVRRLCRACVGALAVAGATAAAAPAAAQPAAVFDLSSWTTIANGDEVVAAAVNPIDGRLWVGSEGGGLVIWNEAGTGFDHFVFPGQPGLLSNTIYDIAFDARNGDAWLATEYGVTHVEHATMSFRTTVADTDLARPLHSQDRVDVVAIDQFPDSRVFNAVAVADDGSIWVGSPDRGVAVRSAGGLWTRYVYDEDEPELGPQRAQVADIAALPSGHVWVAHGRTNFGPVVSVWDPTTGEWSGIAAAAPGESDSDAPRTSQVMSLAVERAAGGGPFSVWCATWNRGVYRYDSGTESWTAFGATNTVVAGEPSSGLCDDTVWAIAERDGAVWAACAQSSGDQGRGVSRWDPTTARWRTFDTDDGLPTDIVTAIALGDGVAYLGTDERKHLTRGSAGVVPVRVGADGLDIGASLRTAGRRPFANEVTALAFDAQDRLWVGTRQAGVQRYDPQVDRWTQFTLDSTGGRLVGDSITDIVAVDDEVWIATTHERVSGGQWSDGGVSVFDLGANDWTRSFTVADAGLASSQVASLALDGAGHAWLGHGLGNSVTGGTVSSDVHQGRGIDVLDRTTGLIIAQHAAAAGVDVAGDTVLDLSARGSEVWAATSYAEDAASSRVGGGVSRWDGAAWTTWRSGDAGLVGYADAGITGDVRSIVADASGYVWAGGYTGTEADILSMWPLVDAVVNRYDPLSNAWTGVQFAREGWVSSIVRDGLDQVWVGTTRGHMQELWRGDGVMGEDVENPRIRDLADYGLHVTDISWQGEWTDLASSNSGLASRAVTALAVEPRTGFVWVGTEGGGLSVYTRGEPLGPPPTALPSATPCPTGVDCPTVTPTPTRTASPTTAPVTIAPTPAPGTVVATAVGLGSNDDEPQPPPEVPEAGTWMLLLTGLGVIGGYAWWRQRHSPIGG